MISIFVVFVICNMIKVYNFDYWEKVEIGLSQVPCYFIGILFAYFSNCIQKNLYYLVALVVLGVIYVVNLVFNIIPQDYLGPLISVPFFILCFSILFFLTASCDRLRWINVLYKWFGDYSFELYILHIFLWFIVKELLKLNSLWNIVLAVVLAIAFAIPVHRITKTICSWIQNRFSYQN